MRALTLVAVGAASIASCGGAAPRASSRPSASGPASTHAAPAPAATPPPASSAPRAAKPDTPREKRATLADLHDRRGSLPIVRGSIAGIPTSLLVDTGANTHVVSAWIARRAKLDMKEREEGAADHAGRTIATYEIAHARVAIDGWGPLADAPVLAAEVPGMYEELGIGGFISPQMLVDAEDGAVVLDLPGHEMRAARYDEAAHRLGRRGTSLTPNGAFACVEDTGIPGLSFVLAATVEGQAASLMIDTGAARSDLLTESAAGKRLAKRSVVDREQFYAASGLLNVRIVKGATIAVGDFAVKTDIALVRGASEPQCPRDGVVSMDVLRACVLVLGKTTMTGRCGMHPD